MLFWGAGARWFRPPDSVVFISGPRGLEEAAAEARTHEIAIIVTERPFVGKHADQAVTQARTWGLQVGYVAAALADEAESAVEIVEVPASTWQEGVLDIGPHTKRDARKAAAVALATRLMGKPYYHGAGEKQHAACDALGIAEWWQRSGSLIRARR